MSVDLKKTTLLSSWKEIASYLDCNVRTCDRWEKKVGLPVHRFKDSNGARVFAYKDELDKWLVERTENKYTPKKAFFPNIRWHQSYYFFLPFVALVAAFIIYFFLGSPLNTPKPANFKIVNSSLIILNEKGKELWRYDTGIERLFDEKAYKEHFQFKTKTDNVPPSSKPLLIIKDINYDGHAEVLFGTQTQDQYGGGELFCFNHKGSLLWKFQIGREMKFGTKIYSPDYFFEGFDVCDLEGDDNLEIIIISNNISFFPTQLVMLNSEGEILGEYWNSGRLSDYAFVDLNGDGKKEIIAAGPNNEFGKGCLVVFDPTKIKGGSPQSGYYKCKELAPGSEKYYILFPRTDVDIDKHPVESIISIDVLKNQRLSVLAGLSRIYYELNYKLEIQDVRFSHTFEQMHKEARLKGKIKNELNEEYRNNLAKGLLYYDGENWVSKPTMSNSWKE
jgi:hypothetical protein